MTGAEEVFGVEIIGAIEIVGVDLFRAGEAGEAFLFSVAVFETGLYASSSFFASFFSLGKQEVLVCFCSCSCCGGCRSDSSLFVTGAIGLLSSASIFCFSAITFSLFDDKQERLDERLDERLAVDLLCFRSLSGVCSGFWCCSSSFSFLLFLLLFFTFLGDIRRDNTDPLDFPLSSISSSL